LNARANIGNEVLRIQGTRHAVRTRRKSRFFSATALSCGLHAALLGLLVDASRANEIRLASAPLPDPTAAARPAPAPEEETWVDLQPAPIILPAIPAEEAPLATEDHAATDRGLAVGRSLAPEISIAADSRAPAPDAGRNTGRSLEPAFRRDRSTLHARLTDGSSRYRPEHERTGRAASSPQASRRERRVGMGDSSRTRRPLVPDDEQASAPSLPADGEDEGHAASAESAPAPHRMAGSESVRGEGPLDARVGERSFDTSERGPARDIRWVRAASDEQHPGLLDLSAVSAPGPRQGEAARGPGQQPGAVDHPSRGTAPAPPGHDAMALGDELSRSAAEQARTRYELEIRRRVAAVLRFPHRLALLLEQGETIVAFTVEPDGRLNGRIRLVKSAGFAEFDAEALSAVAKAAPFPPSGRSHSVSMRIPFENPVVRSGASMVGP